MTTQTLPAADSASSVAHFEPILTGANTPVPPSPTYQVVGGNRFARRLGSLLADSAYTLLSFPFALISFVAVLTGLAVSIPLFIIGIGLPIAIASLTMARGLASVERGRIAQRDAVAGRPVQAESFHTARGSNEADVRKTGLRQSGWRGMLQQFVNPQSWSGVFHAMTSWITSVFTFSVTITWWVGAIAGSTFWIWKTFVPASDNDFSHFSSNAEHLLNLVTSSGFQFGMGILFILTLLPVTRAMANLQSAGGR
jgi:Putative sensor